MAAVQCLYLLDWVLTRELAHEDRVAGVLLGEFSVESQEVLVVVAKLAEED